MERSLNSVTENLRRITATIAETADKCGRDPAKIHLMAVTKTVPAGLVNHAIAQGIRLLGENRAQEMLEKYDDYNKDGVDIHFIGHLQTNKVKHLIGRVSMIQSVDSLKLAREISRLSKNQGVVTELLLEVNVGGEASKSGVRPGEVEALAREIALLDAVKLRGLMSIPPISTNIGQIEGYFSRIQALTVDIKAKNIDNINMDYISMGMSDDYIYAIKYGANILRLGSAIFGARG